MVYVVQIERRSRLQFLVDAGMILGVLLNAVAVILLFIELKETRERSYLDRRIEIHSLLRRPTARGQEEEKLAALETLIELERARGWAPDLTRVNLRNMDLRDFDLRGVNLDRADLSWAQLQGANLCGASLDKAKLDKAKLDQATKIEAGALKRVASLPDNVSAGGCQG